MLFALETEIHKYSLNKMIVQYTASAVHSFCLSYLHTCVPYGTGEFYAEFSMINVFCMVHKIHFIFKYLQLNPGFIFQNTQLFRICISLLIMYSSYMVIFHDKCILYGPQNSLYLQVFAIESWFHIPEHTALQNMHFTINYVQWLHGNCA